MFSSLASFIFGSNTSASTNSEAPLHTAGLRRDQDQQHQQRNLNGNANHNSSVRIDAGNTINLTSSTPSVSGSLSATNAGPGRQQGQGGKRNKGKRNKNNRNKRANTGQWNKATATPTPTITKLLTPNESCDEDLDEDEWFIVGTEDEEDSLPRTDSEEELSVVEVKPHTTATATNSVTPIVAAAGGAQALRQQQQQQQHQHINSHSLYSGLRSHQQRNFLPRQQRNSGARNGAALNVSTLSPPRNITVAGINAGNGATIGAIHSSTLADVENVTQSLYVAPSPASPSSPAPTSSSNSSNCGSEFGANNPMEESWFITPPPCFTSIGPINMETSPYENLLIEHPSMSVYHSIRSAQEAAESFVNLDLGVGESRQQDHEVVVAAVSATSTASEITATNARNVQAVQQQRQARTPSARSDRFTASQLKQELFARSSQKCYEMKERQYLCRGAIKRSNKVRDFQSRGNRQRRSDMQHCKLISGANNNRKCCF